MVIENYFFKVKENQVGTRLDKFICESNEGLTRSRVQSLISDGNVHINGILKNKNYLVRLNDVINIKIPEAVILENSQPENIPIDILYEDQDIIIVNKKKGMVVHPAIGNFSGTLVNALLYHCKGGLSDLNGVIRPGIVHRIDKDTSGLLVAAKNNFAHLYLAQQIKDHSFKRIYEAIAHGFFKKQSGEINLPIGRDNKDRKKFAVTLKNSKTALTFYEVLTNYKNFSHLKLTLKTGRTHQIRVHMSYLNHPLAGDMVYGCKKMDSLEKALKGQCLHAKYIGICHPRSKKFLEFESNLPEYFTNFINKL